MRVAASLALVAAAALSAAAEDRPRAELRSRLERLSHGVAQGCDIFDGGKGGQVSEAAPAPEVSGGSQAQGTPSPVAKRLYYEEVAAPAAVNEPAQVDPIQRMLEGTRNLAHKARLKLQQILDGTRNL